MSDKLVYLMRGLPACGKSHMARRIAGSGGVVLETDHYFYSEVGDDPGVYNYDDRLLPFARDWNYVRFQQAVTQGVSPIVVDRGNGRNAETRRYVEWAVKNGYTVELKEPDSEWWQEIREPLKSRQLNWPILEEWADRLAELSKASHRVPAKTIREWMVGWKHDLTVDEILSERGKN